MTVGSYGIHTNHLPDSRSLASRMPHCFSSSRDQEATVLGPITGLYLSCDTIIRMVDRNQGISSHVCTHRPNFFRIPDFEHLIVPEIAGTQTELYLWTP